MRVALALIAVAVWCVPAAAARPPRLVETCVTKAERTHVLRYRASDGVRLVGLELGRGPRGVVLADKRLIIVRGSAEHGSGLLRFRSLRRGLDAFLAAHSR